MKVDKSGLAVPALGAKELIATLPNISEHVDVSDIAL